MLTTDYIKAEIAKLTKRENMLRQQREAVQAQLHGVIGALGTLREALKASETCEAPPAPETPPEATETPVPQEATD